MPVRPVLRAGFNVSKKNGHYVIGYSIMPNHVHAVIAFHNTGKTINSIVGNGKRFMAYNIVECLQTQNHQKVLQKIEAW